MVGIVGIFDNLSMYEIEVRKEMIELGAMEDDLLLLTKECIWNNFEQKRLPKDVAWTLMQAEWKNIDNISNFEKSYWKSLQKSIQLREKETYIATFKFWFELVLKNEQCEDEFLQDLCNKMSKKLYELPEIQELFPNFNDFDEQFNLSLVDYCDDYGNVYWNDEDKDEEEENE